MGVWAEPVRNLPCSVHPFQVLSVGTPRVLTTTNPGDSQVIGAIWH